MKKIYSLFTILLMAGSLFASTTIKLVVSDYKTTSFSAHGITVTAAKAGAANAPAYNSTSMDLRIYAKGTLTVSCDQEIIGLSFDLSDQGKRRLAPMTVNTGDVEIEGDPDFSVNWTGSANSVTFTVGTTASYGTDSDKAGQFDFTALYVTIDTDEPLDPVNPVDPTVHGDTLTCSQAVNYGVQGDSTEYVVKGFVSDVGSYYNGKIKFCMDDEVSHSTRMFWAEGVQCADPNDAPRWGDLVWVKGKLTNQYNYGQIPGTLPGGTFGIIARGGDAIFTYYDFEEQGVESQGGEVSYYKSGADVYISKGYGGMHELRVYAGSVFEITSDEKDIYKIRFTFSDQTKKGGLNAVETVNAKTWRINSMPSQARLHKIEVFFGKENHEAVETLNVQEKAVKTIQNGILIIERNGVRYNALGQTL